MPDDEEAKKQTSVEGILEQTSFCGKMMGDSARNIRNRSRNLLWRMAPMLAKLRKYGTIDPDYGTGSPTEEACLEAFDKIADAILSEISMDILSTGRLHTAITNEELPF